MPSTGLSSNWDFAPVIDLLRSPTFGGHATSPLPHRESADRLSPGDWPKDVNHETEARTQYLSNTQSYPRLGDFGLLWDLLGQSTAPTDAKASVTEIRHDADAGTCQPRATHPTSIQIFKQPSDRITDNDAIAKSPLRTPPRAIPFSGSSKPRSLRRQAKAEIIDPRNRGTLSEASSSESSAEVEFDGSRSVFDPPLLAKRGALSFIPSQVGTSAIPSEPCYTSPSSFDELEGSLTPSTIKTVTNGGYFRVRPIAYKSTNERRVGLLTKLLQRFPDYAETVSQVGRSVGSSTTSNSSSSVHVFVDMSNIMVGFHDCVKVSRNIPVKTRIRRLPLSFHNFSLILERGRSPAKRVLVGSDRYPAITEAEKIGYETNILGRVHKAKHFTPRQLKFRKNLDSSSQETHGGSETDAAPEERWVEQGVDEILHLKILESLIDTDEPATIVLATGDAAEAEYSGGFMKMVVRALQRGWTVELVSFSQVTSYAYRKKEFRAKWGSRFKLIKLDDYIEELLDM